MKVNESFDARSGVVGRAQLAGPILWAVLPRRSHERSMAPDIPEQVEVTRIRLETTVGEGGFTRRMQRDEFLEYWRPFARRPRGTVDRNEFITVERHRQIVGPAWAHQVERERE